MERRARYSLGLSEDAIYQMVVRALDGRRIEGGLLIDVGCGKGNLWPFVRNRFARHIGVDVVRYEGFPSDGDFVEADLDVGSVPLSDESADVVAAVELIEHLENPRALMRELVRLIKPGGWLFVTMPNQLSLLSLLILVIRRRFAAFKM